MADYRSLELLHVTVTEGVATVVIDHPPVNLFDAAQMREFAQLARMLEADDDVRVVVFRSANPDFFIAHADVGGILDIPADQPQATKLGGFSGMVDRFRTMPKATIAVIEGRVGGGGSEFALSCDMRFAALGQAVFNQPEVGLGILPGGTGTQRLARLAGRSRAMEIILGSDDFDAATAERYGWVNRALPAAELWPFVDRLARRIASFPPEAVAESKALVNLADGAIVDGIVAEQNGFNRLHPLPHVRARMERFLAQGGQTPAGELRLGELVTEIG